MDAKKKEVKRLQEMVENVDEFITAAHNIKKELKAALTLARVDARMEHAQNKNK